MNKSFCLIIYIKILLTYQKMSQKKQTNKENSQSPIDHHVPAEVIFHTLKRKYHICMQITIKEIKEKKLCFHYTTVRQYWAFFNFLRISLALFEAILCYYTYLYLNYPVGSTGYRITGVWTLKFIFFYGWIWGG